MEEFSKELLFAQTLEKVRQIAKSQGNYINENQVRAEFSGLDLSDGRKHGGTRRAGERRKP